MDDNFEGDGKPLILGFVAALNVAIVFYQNVDLPILHGTATLAVFVMAFAVNVTVAEWFLDVFIPRLFSSKR